MNAPTQIQSTRPSKARDPRSVELGYRSPTEYGALSSDGETVYSVRFIAGAWVCMCKGYAARMTCCRVAAVLLPHCFHCGDTEGVAVYTNGWDGGAEILLCASCAGH